MIYINHTKKAIFIHIPKTGGSYIGPTLEKYYGFINYLQLIINKRPDHDSVCQTKMFRKVMTNNDLYDNSFFNKMIGLFLYCKTSDYLSKEMNMDEEKWNTYAKFCFIRNPYSRILSGWNHFNIIFKRKVTLFDYVNNPNILNTISDIEYGHVFMTQQKQIIDLNGLCGVNMIGRFEYLEKDLTTILNCIGFTKMVHPVKYVNVSNKSGSEDLILESKVVNKINQLFKDDFEVFHYEMLQ